MKTESSSSTQEVKVKPEESETVGENATSVKHEEQQEEQAPEPDSEDSFTPERAIEVIQRLREIQESGTREDEQENREIPSPYANPRERISGSETSRGHEYTVHTHRKGQEEQDEDTTRQIHSCSILLFS